jgi:hypothetical protein
MKNEFVEFGGMRIGGGTEELGGILPQCHFDHGKFHVTCSVVEQTPPRCKPGN